MINESVLEVLTEIWQQKLKLPRIGAQQDFFELGGDCDSAVEVFKEINKALGRDLPAVMIFQAPTIASLASLLTQPWQCPPILMMNSGTENPPIFFAHGLGKDAMQLLPLVRHIDLKNKIYATQARGIDGLEPPLEAIEDMADFFLPAIRAIQPQGPYFLIGYSFGGLVMLEMAQRLHLQGQKVGLLTMLDSYPHRTHLRPAQRVSLFIQLAKRRIHSLTGKFRMAEDRRGGDNNENNSAVNLIQQRIHQGELQALRGYQPTFYPGKLNFVQAEIPTYFPRNARKVWANLVADLELETAPGNHMDMVGVCHRTVAELLTRYLVRSLSKNHQEPVNT
jgi:thioesterase domain-containing protein